MKLKQVDREFESNVSQSIKFGIRPEDASMIASFLREKIYTNPLQATIREIISNGWDSQVNAETTHIPMEVSLVTSGETILKYFSVIGENFFRVRDFGTGMDYEKVTKIFANFGASDKRDNDNQIGGFGLGAKAPLGYATAFALTSWVDGTRWDWIIGDDAEGNGGITLINQIQEFKPNGVEVTIPIAAEDSKAALQWVKHYCQFITPTPIVDGFELNLSDPVYEGADWRVYKNDSVSNPSYDILDNRGSFVIALVGNVPYILDANYVRNRNPFHRKDFMIVMDFDIADLQVHLSRERLDETPANYAKIQDKFEGIKKEVAVQTIEGYEKLHPQDLSKNLNNSIFHWAFTEIANLNFFDCVANYYGVPKDDIKNFIACSKGRAVTCQGSNIWTEATGRMFYQTNWDMQYTYYHSYDRANKAKAQWLLENEQVSRSFVVTYKSKEIWDAKTGTYVPSFSKDRWYEIAKLIGMKDYADQPRVKAPKSPTKKSKKVVLYKVSTSGYAIPSEGPSRFERIDLDEDDSFFDTTNGLFLPYAKVREDVYTWDGYRDVFYLNEVITNVPKTLSSATIRPIYFIKQKYFDEFDLEEFTLQAYVEDFLDVLKTWAWVRSHKFAHAVVSNVNTSYHNTAEVNFLPYILTDEGNDIVANFRKTLAADRSLARFLSTGFYGFEKLESKLKGLETATVHLDPEFVELMESIKDQNLLFPLIPSNNNEEQFTFLANMYIALNDMQQIQL